VDFIASAIYIVDFFMLWFNSERVMEMLEVTNPADNGVKDLFSNLSQTTRSLPSMVIFLAASKTLLLLTFNCALVYVYFVAAWKVCRENQKVILKVTTLKKSKNKENKNKLSQPVEGSAIHRIESSTTPANNQPKVKKTEKVKNKKEVSNERDETELPTIYKIETPTLPPPEVPESETTTSNNVDKAKKEKKVKPAKIDAPRHETELPESIQLPRITYQKQPSQEEIPLPIPPSFNNKRNQKTKF
jgi:FtsZ-interacting cell division protein ZipA